MTTPRMQTMLCTIHNFHFAYEDKKGIVFQCPICTDEKMIKLRLELAVVIQHRDILLQAIEIKHTVVLA